MKSYTLQPTVAATTDITAPAPMFLGDEKYYAVQAVFSAGAGDIVGTFKLQRSVDGTNFEDIPGSTKSVTSSATAILDTASQTGNPSAASYPYVRFYWDFTSGTGNITVYGIIKQNQVYD